MNDFSVDQVVSLLPHAQQPVFAKLSGRLKEICVMRLSSFEPEIPTLALKILSTTSENKGWEDKERFLIHFLSQIYPETQKTLERVLKIAEQGFFNELNSQVDNKKKEALAVKKMIATIEEFETDTLPQLLQKKADNQLLVQHSTLPTSSSPLVKNYEKLMDCQVYFAFPQLVNEFLDLLPFNQKWKPTIYAYLFHLLNVPYNLHFNDFEKLKLCKTLFRLHHPLHPTKFEYCYEVDIREFIDSAFQLKEKEGEEPLVYYFASLDKNSDELNLNDMIRVLNLLLSAGKDGDLCKVIENWKKKKLRWGKLFEILETDLAQQGLNLSLLKEDVPALLARFKKDSTVIYPLSDQQLQQIQSHYQTVRQFCEKYHQLKFNQLMNRAHEIRSLAKQGAIDQVKRLELVAIGRLAIRLEFGIYPYHTQIFALLGILLDGKSRQAQVKTGEGKSTIVALWAFVMAMEGQGVDIVTSARYLAMRDHDKFARFFKRCGITSSHICYDHKRPEYFARPGRSRPGA